MVKSSGRSTRVLLGIVLLAAWSSQAGADTAGVFQFVTGDVQLILAAGGQRPASKGSPVSIGDTITTARRATAQLKMRDGGIVVVQPESRLTVAEFRYKGKEDGTEHVLYRLEQGGFRAVTGAIGRTNKSTYLIETPIAHIGIRGTDHESYYFTAVGPRNGEPARAGVYNKVNVGRSYIRNRSGEVVVGPAEVGYAASADDVPVLLAAMPEFFNRAFAPRRAQLDGAPIPTLAEGIPQFVQTVSTASGLELSGPVAAAAAEAGALLGSLVAHTNLLGEALSGINLPVSSNGATLVNAGGDPAFAVNWGSWQGGLALVDGLATLNTSTTHFIESTRLTTTSQLAALPAAGLVTATYNYAGGPAPTNALGTQGTITGLSVAANFSTQTVTNYAVNANVGGLTPTSWTATGNGTFAQFTGSSGIALSGTCTGCALVPTAATGSANGAFVGSAAEKMITSFGLNAAPQSISGAAYLSR
jgi:hypothetical protein